MKQGTTGEWERPFYKTLMTAWIRLTLLGLPETCRTRRPPKESYIASDCRGRQTEEGALLEELRRFARAPDDRQPPSEDPQNVPFPHRGGLSMKA